MRRLRRVGIPMLLALVASMLPAVATAHPLGNFTINHYAALRVAADRIELDVVIDMAEVPTVEASARLDADGDGVVSDEELDAARGRTCADLTPDLLLEVGGAQPALDLTAAGLGLTPGAAGLPTLRIVCEYVAGLAGAPAAPWRITFADRSRPERLGWREIVVLGDGLVVTPVDAGRDVSQRLTTYPQDLLSRPLDERSLSVTVDVGGPALAPFLATDASPIGPTPALPTETIPPDGETPVSAVPGGVGAELASFVDFRNLTLPAMLLGLIVAAVAGAGHALSPGHGKTVMTAFLIGTRGGPRHALMLGAAVTLSHTLGVIGLAALAMLAGDWLPPERLYPVLTVGSGVTVLAIGTWMLVQCAQRALARREPDDAHDDEAVHERAETPAHRHGWRTHVHTADTAGTAVSADRAVPGWRSLVAIGVAGGLVPSTAALILLLAALAAGQPAYGFALALAFGLGMAAVLSGIGLAIVVGRDRIASRVRLPALLGLGVAVPWITAGAVLVGGVLLTGQAVALQF